MKNLICTWIALISLQSYASDLTFKTLECTIGYSYGIRYIVAQKTVELWEFAGGLGSPLRDFTVESDVRANGKVTLQLTGMGNLSVDFSDPWSWARGSWEHSHKLDQYLIDSPDDHGSAELIECTKK